MSGVLDAAAGLVSPWAYVVLGLLAAAESAAFVGLAVPGETAMLLGGFLAYQGRVNLAAMMAAGAAGAVVGDSIGYQIGRLFGEPLKRSRLGRRVGGDRWARGEAYLRAKGGRAVFLGRFVGLLRALVPALAGMSRMPYRTFLPWNVAGGIIWAPGFVLLGYLAGGSYRQVERAAGRASLLLVVLVVVVGVVVVAARWVARHPDRLRAVVDRQLDRPWVARLRARYRGQLAFLAERLRPGGALGLSLTVSVMALVGAGWAFGAVLQDVLAGDEGALLDGPVHRFFLAHREAWLTPVMRGATNLGGDAVLTGLILLAGLAWWLRTRGWRLLWMLAGAYLGAWALSETIRDLTHRARPPAAQAIGHWSGYAFPSPHTTKAAAVYGMLAALLAVATPHWRRKVALWTVALLIAGLVGLSELYLGAQWLTDVLGALTLGAAWLFVLLTAAHTMRALHTRTHAPPAPADARPAGATAPKETTRLDRREPVRRNQGDD
ncbi:MAG TPA: bifunctional DedA family/phosphatase PAP2 family protein [Actinomycetes bacterium]|jgi:undecaprenyl-diphosphatase|nr:bifunctional DedA family/phosphatase PAP2 family protein [Actinomycetes bacterium]